MRSSQPDAARGLFRDLIVPVVAGVLGLAFAWWVRSWQSFTPIVHICPGLFCDFSDYYFPMGETIFRTGLPVEGFLYSPFIAVLLAAFAPPGLDASLVLWGILQVAFVSLYVLLFRRLVPARPSILLLFVALTLTSFPFLFNLVFGQVSVFIMVGILGMLALNERRRSAAAGSLAFAVSIKFYPILFLAPFAARRDTRFLLVAAAVCVTSLFLVPAGLLGIGGTLAFYGALIDAFRDSAWVVTNPHSQFLPHVVLRLTGAAEAHLPLLRLVSYGLAAVNAGFVFLIQRARRCHADLWSVQIIFLTIPFLLKTSWPHDFVFLSFTQALLAWRLLAERKEAVEANRAGTHPHQGSAVTWVLLLTSIVLSNVIFYHLFGDFTRYGFFGFLFWADLLLLVALYLELLPHTLQPVRGRS